ncbi:hypothetical protein FHS85_002163 [Rhodoligotrophos appendicifer]
MDRPWLVIATSIIACICLAIYAANTLTVNVDTNDLFSRDAPFLQAEDRFNALFPGEADQILVVLDGPTKLKADQAADKLVERLSQEKSLFPSIQQPGGGEFFRRNGLLYLTPQQLEAFSNQLTKAQPILATLSANPTLVGMLDVVSLIFQGATMGEPGVADSHAFLTQLTGAIDNGLNGKPASLDWSALLGGSIGPKIAPRAFILIHPKLDTGQLTPGKPASDRIRATANELGLTEANGYSVRLTGSVPLSDEEFATVEHGSTIAILLSVSLVIIILAFALHSWKLIFSALVVLGMGFLGTMGWAALAIGELNLISIGFTVMFVGIAIDFGIQFCMRLREERHRIDDFRLSLESTGNLLARPLLLAAVATSAGFFSFLPTSYRGVAELGVIAGGGILIAFVLTVTLLPALLAILVPGPEKKHVGFTRLRPVNDFLVRQRLGILGASALVSLLAFVGLFLLRFDFDPLHLKDPTSESMATLMSLASDPWTTPYTLNVLTDGPETAREMATKLSQLPEVRDTMTIFSFVPEEQARKLEILENLSLLLGPVMDTPIQPTQVSIDDLSGALDGSRADIQYYLESDQVNEPTKTDAANLSAALNRLAAVSDPAKLQAISNEIVGGFGEARSLMVAVLDPQTVTPESLPESLRRSWIAPDGQYRIVAYPRGDAQNPDELLKFVDAVRTVAPDATGMPITIHESSSLVINAFITAAILASISIAILLWLTLRRVSDVVRTLLPLLLAGLWTLGLCGLIGIQLNFANIIGLPLLLGIGVTFPIYLVHSWRHGENNLLSAPVARAVMFSALTVLASFGSLAISSHPGTSQLGILLTIALGLTLVASFIFLPSLLGKPPQQLESRD